MEDETHQVLRHGVLHIFFFKYLDHEVNVLIANNVLNILKSIQKRNINTEDLSSRINTIMVLTQQLD